MADEREFTLYEIAVHIAASHKYSIATVRRDLETLIAVGYVHPSGVTRRNVPTYRQKDLDELGKLLPTQEQRNALLDKAMAPTDRLLSTDDLAERYGLRRTDIHQLSRGEGFPQPTRVIGDLGGRARLLWRLDQLPALDTYVLGRKAGDVQPTQTPEQQSAPPVEEEVAQGPLLWQAYQLAARYDVSVGTINAWARQGKIAKAKDRTISGHRAWTSEQLPRMDKAVENIKKRPGWRSRTEARKEVGRTVAKPKKTEAETESVEEPLWRRVVGRARRGGSIMG